MSRFTSKVTADKSTLSTHSFPTVWMVTLFCSCYLFSLNPSTQIFPFSSIIFIQFSGHLLAFSAKKKCPWVGTEQKGLLGLLCVLSKMAWAWSSGPCGGYLILYRCGPLIIFLLTRLFYNSLRVVKKLVVTRMILVRSKRNKVYPVKI